MRLNVAGIAGTLIVIGATFAGDATAQAPTCRWSGFSAGGQGSTVGEQTLIATSGLSCRVGPISGSLNNVRVVTPPSRGRVEMQGAFYTYTPNAIGPGQDFFQLSWWPAAGPQQFLAVRVTIVGNGPGPSPANPAAPIRK